MWRKSTNKEKRETEKERKIKEFRQEGHGQRLEKGGGKEDRVNKRG
jgi:hypothetical protein